MAKHNCLLRRMGRWTAWAALATAVWPTGGLARTRITWAVPGVLEEMEARQAQAKRFQELHPDIEVEILAFPDDEFDEKVFALFAAGTPPDLFVSGDVLIPWLVQQKMALDLTPFIQRDRYDLSDFFPPIIDFFTINGSLYSLTDNWDAQVVYYNKTMLDQHGVAAPDLSWTWDTVLEAGKKLTKGRQANQFGLSFSPWFAPVFSFIWQNNGDLFSPDFSRVTIDNPATVEALQWVADLFNRHGVSLFWDELDRMDTDPVDYFASGHAGMLFDGGRWHAHWMHNEITHFDWRIAPLPKKVSHASFFHLSTYVISANSAHRQEAWELLKFLVGREGQQINARYAEGIPSRRSVALDPSFLKDPAVLAHNSVEPFLQLVPYLRGIGRLTTWRKVISALEPEFLRLWRGEQSALETATKLKPVLQALLEEGKGLAQP